MVKNLIAIGIIVVVIAGIGLAVTQQRGNDVQGDVIEGEVFSVTSNGTVVTDDTVTTTEGQDVVDVEKTSTITKIVKTEIDDREQDDTVTIYNGFSQATVDLYYPSLGGPCDAVTAEVPTIGLPVRAETQEGLYREVFNMLVRDPSQNFMDERYRESYVTGYELQDLSYDYETGVLTLVVPGLSVGGRCESVAAINQVKQTMLDLPGVNSVSIPGSSWPNDEMLPPGAPAAN